LRGPFVDAGFLRVARRERFGDFAIRAGYVVEVREGRHFNDGNEPCR
jgi:hypothetical protein